ncbi:MAG: CRISPR-associated endonuclease Cas3'' [Planctomycetales bacterium]|nr:CRISPR-associated endonuclease Cas3'' [Planctomycetales bacterium]
MNNYYAHSLAGRLPLEWEPLDDHLQAVASRAGEFAACFGARDWGRVAGLWHDLGKYSSAFQAYLHRENDCEAHLEQFKGRVDHSTAGAQHAAKSIRPWGRMLAYAIAGHHAGLANAAVDEASLDARLKKNVEPYDAAPNEILSVANQLSTPALTMDHADRGRAAFQMALFTRMVFSCLVDADFLATESFLNPQQAAARPVDHESLAAMAGALDRYLDELSDNSQLTRVGRCRQEVLAACRSAAELQPGFFSLTVPTGGGKTLASLALAIKHAQRAGLRRVIYAIPFTSIIEQTAAVFRRVFAGLNEAVVLEHHSNFDPRKETVKSRLAAENWDTPLVVTTNVQLFESLYAARTSRCRKLHNLVGSVIILDEAQTLPVELVQPCLAVLRELVTDYGCSVVLCTATQPALEFRESFPIGLRGVREIVPNPERLYAEMKRVEVRSLGRIDDASLADRLAIEDSFLAIVNTRPHAARLFLQLADRLGRDDSLFHLSTNLCGQHRTDLLKVIRDRLAAGHTCRVLSTQLIEAGVDIDFPVVYRALSGLDSVAQAAGRCNREGRLDRATVWVFEPTDVTLRGYLKSVASTAAEVLPDFDDPLDPAAIARYFQLHYWKQAGDDCWDKPGVMRCFPNQPEKMAFDFRTAAERFRMIDDATVSVFVPYGKEGPRLLETLRYAGPSRQLLRQLQRYTVGVYQQAYDAMRSADIEELPSGYAILVNADAYDDRLGLRTDRIGFHEPESLVI